VGSSLRMVLPVMFMLAIPVLGWAASPAPTRFNFTAGYVGVTRQTTDPVAHVDTIISIYTYSPGDHPSDAPPTVISDVGLYMLVRNTVTHETLYFDTGEAANFESHMTPGLTAATLTAVILTRHGSLMHVDLSWIAAGPIANNVSGPVREEVNEFIVLERAGFKERPALVSGTLSGGPIAITFVDVPNARMGYTHQSTIYLRDPR